MGRRLLTSLAAATAAAAAILITSVVPASADPAAAPALADSNTAARSTGVTPNSQLPDVIKVDENQFKIVATLRGVGKQVYDCQPDNTYKFREPVAGLFTSRGVPTGIHGVGPFWASFDGSRVNGAVVGSVPQPAPNIAWLKLTGTPFGASGIFSKVAFIQRIDTRGGVAPTSCTAPSTASVDYTTNYVFWAPK